MESINPTVKIIDLESVGRELSGKIKQYGCSIFCGAGISFDSGLPVVVNFLNYLFQKMELAPLQIKLLLNSELPFEAIMETINTEVGIEPLVEVFNGTNPNTNHILIAKLAKLGYTNTICTTNFDQLIEKALANEGLVPGKDFITYKTAQELQNIDWDSKQLKVIKLHGCTSQKEGVAITMQLVASGDFLADRVEIIRRVFTGVNNLPVLMLGYSCSDVFDISLGIESLTADYNDVNIIDHSNDRDHIIIEDIQTRVEKNPFKQFDKGKRFYINTEAIVQKLWENLIVDKYLLLKYEQANWNIIVDQWLINIVNTESDSIKHHINGRLLYDIGAFVESLRENHEAVKLAQRNGNIKALGAALGNLGLGLNALSEFDSAKDVLEEAIRLSKISQNKQGEASQLGALGILLHHLGLQEESLSKHEEALKIEEDMGDEFTIGTTLGNMGNIYNSLGQYEKVIDIIERALRISKKWGNKQSESSQLGIIATAYFSLGEKEKALESLLKGIDIKKYIGDKRGEAMLWANLSNIYLDRRLNANALQACYYGLNLAQQIEDKKTEAIILYTIGRINYDEKAYKLAANCYKDSIAIFSSLYPNGHPYLEMARNQYAAIIDLL